MKNRFHIHFLALLALLFVGCEEEREFQAVSVAAPSEVGATFSIASDNSGKVTIAPTATGASMFYIGYGDGSANDTIANGEIVSHIYAEGDFTVSIDAISADGQMASTTQELVIRFDPPENLSVDIQADSRSVTVTPSADGATLFEVYFGETEGEDPVTVMPGESTGHLYGAPGEYTIRVIAKGAGAATAEVVENIEVFDSIFLPLNFEGDNVGFNFNGFGGGSAEVIDNPDPTDPNASAKVVRFVKVAGSETWGGVTLDVSEPVDFANFGKVKMMVWSPKVGAQILFKAENIDNADLFAEVIAETTVANQWEEIIFDFEGVDPALELRRLAFFFDFGVSGDDQPYYFDNVQLTNEGDVQLELPIDFESSAIEYNFESFGRASAEVVDNPSIDAANGSAKVAKLNKSDGSEPWAGTLLQLPEPIDFSTEQQFSIKTYSPKAGATVLFKIENASDGNVFVENTATTTVENAWETLTFDMSAVDQSQQYSKVVVFFDFGNAGDGSDYYFDAIVQGAPPADRLTMPISFESETLAYSFQNFGNATSEVVANPDPSGINTSAKVGQTFKAAGAEVWAGSFLELEENIDFANSPTLKVKVWSPKAGAVVRVKVENLANGGEIFYELDATTTTSGEWEELTYDFSGIDNSQVYGRLVIFFDFGNNGDDSNYYFDDFRVE